MYFFEQVYRLVRMIPRGRVATYGQIARLISTGRAARAVGWALRALPDDTDVPWQRVVGRGGMITIIHPHVPKQSQVKILRSEGVTISECDGNFFVDLDKYLWHADEYKKPSSRAPTRLRGRDEGSPATPT